MRLTAWAVSTALIFSAASLGCKSAPKMSWWKNSDGEKVAAADASAAPQLPSEVAVQAGDLQSIDSVQISSAPVGSSAAGSAPAFTPTAGAYPNTGAPSYVPTASQGSTAGTDVVTSPVTSVAMPYDPTAVPAPKLNASASSVAQNSNAPAAAYADRYGSMASAAINSAAPVYSGAAPSTGNYAVSSTVAQGVNVSPANPEASSPLGSRYAGSAPQQPTATGYINSDASVQTASAMATAQPYRPGGTSSYPGGSAGGGAPYEVATRTDASGQAAGYGSDPSYSEPTTQYR